MVYAEVVSNLSLAGRKGVLTCCGDGFVQLALDGLRTEMLSGWDFIFADPLAVRHISIETSFSAITSASAETTVRMAFTLRVIVL